MNQQLLSILKSLNASRGEGFITSAHQNGNKGIVFRRLWGDRVDFVEFSLFKTAEGEFAELCGHCKLIN